MTDIQAAIGSAQMDKLPVFCATRRKNFNRWMEIFSKYEEYFILPRATLKSDPAWFAFIVTLKEDAPFTRDQLTAHLNAKLIETRNLFAGNMTRQPGFENRDWRIADHLKNTDIITDQTFFLGTYPGLSSGMLDYASNILDTYLNNF